MIYNPGTVPIYADPLYAALIPFAAAMTAIGWTITATDSTGTSAPAFTTPFNPVLQPFVSNVLTLVLVAVCGSALARRLTRVALP